MLNIQDNKQALANLVALYDAQRQNYLNISYNETQLRSDFLDRFFEILGWDIKNDNGKPTNEREVVLEESLKASASENAKKPDYTFRLFSERKFFVEAKKPSVHLENNPDTAKQIRRYGFTAKLKISALSNFENLIIYDCSEPVLESDPWNKCLIEVIHYSKYVERYEDIVRYLGKESVYSGQFDEEWKNIEEKIKLFSIDTLFLNQINEWRLLLGNEVYKYSPHLNTEQLNDYVQGYLNSIIFLRVCEDRNLEEYQTLLKFATDQDFKSLINKFVQADKRYNAGLFKHYLSDDIIKNISSAFWIIIKKLYYPESPYSFSVFSSEILGNIYEIFLSQKLVVDAGKIQLVNKPENIDKDIITTPNFVIKNILRETVLPYIQDKTVNETLECKLADISCGSGAFLLEAFQLLNDAIIDKLILEDAQRLIQVNVNAYKLSFDLKKQLLTSCIYGVDKDYNAVQAAKFGLLLKLLENEDSASLQNKTAVLPDLISNIIFGNSLISPNDTQGLSEEEISQINPYDFLNGPYDIIVGNPPYMKAEDMKNVIPQEYKLYSTIYNSAYKQYDKYYLFVERGVKLLKPNGILGYILPSKFMKIGSGAKLREFLATGRLPTKIVSFGANQIFEHRTTYTCLLFIQNKVNTDLSFYEVKSLSNWKIKQAPTNELEHLNLEELNNENWILLESSLKEAYEKILSQSIPLKEFVGSENIFNGIQTSANDIYVINNYSDDGSYISFEKNGVNYKVERELTRPYFETSSGIDNLNTYRQFKANSLVIYPYKKSNGKIDLVPLSTLQISYPFLYQYLETNKERLEKRDIKPLPVTSEEWYRFGRHQSLDKLDIPCKIIVGVLSTGDKYAIDNNGTFISSGGTAGYCTIVLDPSSPYSIYYLQAVLNSKYVEWVCTLVGDVFRGGYFSHGTAVLEKLPIRTIDFNNPLAKDLHDQIASLQQELIGIQSSIDLNSDNEREKIKFERNFASKKAELDQHLEQLYGLGPIDVIIPLMKDLYEAD